ncbi:GNAT family N-acetyltransferase [Breznakiella homolactica]|uniref:GNAT family N-acetyltransferase n=1 Tax=Breznakiella homolactica TaxID=2798577 RepID=A0A7T7XNS3_9SPIR|nr:GNAT family N-acetyltransferase [Breznakiella homolactica]QQO09657.1 GNAT family N-acetyltransferase [Breznakiella homolactica]
MDNLRRWKRMRREKDPGLEAFLRDHEPYCVSACGRLLREGGRNHIWGRYNDAGTIEALLMHSRRSLFPVSWGTGPKPEFLDRFLNRYSIHAVQGLAADVAVLDRILAGKGLPLAEGIDYDLMALDGVPAAPERTGGPVLRGPAAGDMDSLYELQAAYEKEEVLPKGAEFNPAACRRSVERIAAEEEILVAELGGRLIGKINTNARSFTRYQIGGVYVLPEFRGRGIATSMAAAFARELCSKGWGLSLFVKKSNIPARTVYDRIGFKTIADFRISYY